MALLTLISFIFTAILYIAWKRYIKSGPIYNNRTLFAGKTILITGGSSGLGKECATALAKCQARVIIASRNFNKGKMAMSEIQETTGNKNVHFMKLDLSELDNVREFVNSFNRHESRLDVLINCAGIISSERNKDGKHGLMFTCNVLGPFLLTNLLLPVLRKTGESRIINVASDAYLVADIDLLKLDPCFDGRLSSLSVLGHYAATKLMVIYMNAELNRLLSCDSLVTTYALHPGTVKSNLGVGFVKNNHILRLLRHLVMKLLARSPFYCSQTVLYCCSEPGIEKYSGGYFSELRPASLFPHAEKIGIGRKLWEELERMAENG